MWNGESLSLECEDSDHNTSTSKKNIPKLLVRNDDVVTESEDSEDDTSASEGIMRKSLK